MAQLNYFLEEQVMASGCTICNDSFKILDEHNKPWPCVCTFREHEVNNDPHIFHRDGSVSLRNPPKNWDNPPVPKTYDQLLDEELKHKTSMMVSEEVARAFRNVTESLLDLTINKHILSCTTTNFNIGIGYVPDNWKMFTTTTQG